MMSGRQTAKLFTLIPCILLPAAPFVLAGPAAAYRPTTHPGGAPSTGIPHGVSPHPSAPAYHGPSASPAPSPPAGGMVELTRGRPVDIPTDQFQNIQGISGESTTGKQPGALYYRATGPVKVPRVLAGASVPARGPGASVVPEMRKRITCIYLDPDEWYLDTGTYSEYGGTVCYRHQDGKRSGK